ncbi:unnamed protein product, partial [Arabidopsis halleri]
MEFSVTANRGLSHNRQTLNKAAPLIPPGFSPLRQSLIKCQLCGVYGHCATQCIQLQASNQSPQLHSMPQANAASPTSPWLLDSGATHHITSNLQHLRHHQPYIGHDAVTIADGSGVSITHTGSTTLPSSDLATGTKLLQGRTQNELYEWPISSPPITAFSTSPNPKTSITSWHSRLGHPALPILKTIVSQFSLPVSNSIQTHCNDCSINKSHKLPFYETSIVSRRIYISRHVQFVETSYPFVSEKSMQTTNGDLTTTASVYDSTPTVIPVQPRPLVQAPPPPPESPRISDLQRQPPLLNAPPLRVYTRRVTKSAATNNHGAGPSSNTGALPYAPPVINTHVLPLPSRSPESVSPSSSSHTIHEEDNLLTGQVSSSGPTNQSSNNSPSNSTLSPQNSPLTKSPNHTQTSPLPRSHSSSPTTTPTPTSPDHEKSPSPSPEIPPPPPQNHPLPPPPQNNHPMQTRAKNQISKPKTKFSLTTSLTSSKPVIPTTVTQALKDPNWRNAMSEEINAQLKNHTWDLVAPEAAQHVISC